MGIILILLIFLLAALIIPLSVGLIFRKVKVIRRTCYGLFIAVSIWIMYSWSVTTFHTQVPKQYATIKTFLNSSEINSPLQSQLDWERSLLCFSMLSEGLTSYGIVNPDLLLEIVPLIEKLITLITSPEYSGFKEDRDLWIDEGLYLSHLNIMLGAHERLSKSGKYSELNKEISQFLREQLINSPNHHIKSYGYLEQKWTCDNAAIVYSIWLYDQNYGANLSATPIEKWMQFALTHARDPITMLPCTELILENNCHQVPRGHSLSWIATYMSRFSPEQAEVLYKGYKKHFKKSYLFIGGAFKEFPDHVDSFMDYDSGPIIIGVGGAASGLALRASSHLQDGLTYYQLNNTMALIDIIIWADKIFDGHSDLENKFTNLLATSIRFEASVQTKWF